MPNRRRLAVNGVDAIGCAPRVAARYATAACRDRRSHALPPCRNATPCHCLPRRPSRTLPQTDIDSQAEMILYKFRDLERATVKELQKQVRRRLPHARR